MDTAALSIINWSKVGRCYVFRSITNISLEQLTLHCGHKNDQSNFASVTEPDQFTKRGNWGILTLS